MALIGFIGLGIMGAPMAANLVSAGHRVRGYSRTDARRTAAAARGIEPANSVRHAVAGAEFVITMLPDTPDVQGVMLGEDGVFAAAERGAIVVDMSTIAPDATRELHRKAADYGLGFLDAPVSGGEAGAIAGGLAIMVGGDEGDFARVRPILEVLGSRSVHVGRPGAGQTVKAANQMVVAGNIQILAEALWFLRGHGLDLALALDVLGGGLAGSAVIEHKREALLEASFEPGFRLELHHKDLGIAQRAAREVGAALPVVALVTQLVQAAVARGNGGQDHSALYALVAELNGETL